MLLFGDEFDELREDLELLEEVGMENFQAALKNKLENEKIKDDQKPEFKMPSWLQEARDVHGHPLRPTKQLEDPQPGLRRLR